MRAPQNLSAGHDHAVLGGRLATSATSTPGGLRPGDRLHDVDSAAGYLRCGRRLIYRLVAERRIRFTYAGRCLRIWQSDLDAYLLARSVEPLEVG